MFGKSLPVVITWKYGIWKHNSDCKSRLYVVGDITLQDVMTMTFDINKISSLSKRQNLKIKHQLETHLSHY